MADSTAPEKRGKKAAQTKPPTDQAAEERIVSLPLAELHPFPNHPFKVRDDETMQETAESIKQYGILVPAIVRPREEGGYEIVAGHRRKHACELAGLETMPVIIRNLDADAAMPSAATRTRKTANGLRRPSSAFCRMRPTPAHWCRASKGRLTIKSRPWNSIPHLTGFAFRAHMKRSLRSAILSWYSVSGIWIPARRPSRTRYICFPASSSVAVVALV